MGLDMRRSVPVFFATVVAIFGVASVAYGAIKPETISMQNALGEISGFWYTEDRDGGVELYSCGTEVCGRFYWLKENGPADNVSLDSRNPDPDKRSQPLCREQFMGGFAPDGDGHYINGWIYSPRHGATFQAEMTLIDHDTLDLHGYVLMPALGESQVWKRADKLPSCVSG